MAVPGLREPAPPSPLGQSDVLGPAIPSREPAVPHRHDSRSDATTRAADPVSRFLPRAAAVAPL